MRKVLVKVTLLSALLLCMFVLTVSAFSPVGNILVEKTEITLDGVISEGEYPFSGHRLINEGNSTAQGWVGAYPANTYLNIYFAWDDDNLYVAGDVIDPTFRYCPEQTYLDGDSCQLSLNIDNIFKTVGPESRAIFYSWALQLNGTIDVIRQESVGDGVLNNVGKGLKTDNGWCFEIALSWDVLLEDVQRNSKTLPEIHDGTEIGALFCYLDVDAQGELGAAFGTSSTETMGWDPAAHGMTLTIVGDRMVNSGETEAITTPEETTELEEIVTSEVTTEPEITTEPEESEKESEKELEKKESARPLGAIIGIVVAVLVVIGIVVIVKKKK